MSITSKLLPVLAVAAALSPLAAYARNNPQPGPAQYYLAPLHHHAAQPNIHADRVMVGSATIDRPSPFYTDTNSAGR